MRLVGFLSFHIYLRLWNNYCWNKRTAVCIQDDVFSRVYETRVLHTACMLSKKVSQ